MPLIITSLWLGLAILPEYLLLVQYYKRPMKHGNYRAHCKIEKLAWYSDDRYAPQPRDDQLWSQYHGGEYPQSKKKKPEIYVLPYLKHVNQRLIVKPFLYKHGVPDHAQ